MGRRIPGWTDRHTRVAVAGALAFIAVGAAFAEQPSQGLLLVAAAATVFILGLVWDSWVGIIIGLGGAAVVIFIRQWAGRWLPADFLLAAVQSAALVGTGWAAGTAGRMLRAPRGGNTDDGVRVAPAFGSIGMLPAELALVRLEEEVARASSYRRPLSLAILEVESVEPDLDEASRAEIFRALARLTETMLREIDVPFLFAADRIGAILPETGAVAAAVASGRILEAVSAGRFSDRRRQSRRALTDAVAVRLAVVSMSPTLSTAGELVDRATSTLEGMRLPR